MQNGKAMICFLPTVSPNRLAEPYNHMLRRRFLGGGWATAFGDDHKGDEHDDHAADGEENVEGKGDKHDDDEGGKYGGDKGGKHDDHN